MRAFAAFCVAAFIAGVLWVAFHPPVHGAAYPPCMFHSLTGLHCPGCGGTRSIYLMSHGDFAGALRQNALVVIFAPLALLYLLAAIRFSATGYWKAPRLSGPGISVALAVAIVAFAVLRNIPVAGLELLAPVELR